MNFAQIPDIDNKQLCDLENLCSIRKEQDKELLAIKYPDQHIEEVALHEIIHQSHFQGLPIERIYSSGHVFINQDLRQVYLIKVEKNGHIQHQFT
ncbi:MAG: hypothetical protein GXP45_04100 [bacterium]|nr:hypothetical protein [bacterium]